MKAITEFGILVVIAGIFIIGVVKGITEGYKVLSKFLTDLIGEFKSINKNMADQNETMKSAWESVAISLEIIKNQTSDIDHKTDGIITKITEVCTRVEGCNKK